MHYKIAVSLLVIVLTGINAHAQICAEVPAAFIIRGRVIAPGENWDRNYEVLQFAESRLAAWTYTDSNGEFALPEQPGGNYWVVVRIDGFKESRVSVRATGCTNIVDHFVFMEFDDEIFRPVILDFTGEVNEIVDVTELKRDFPQKAVNEFQRARNDRLEGESDRARGRLEKLVAQYPDFYDARNALGSVYLEMQRFRDAETQYNEARRLKPSSAAPLVSLGSLYVQEAEASLSAQPGVATVILPMADLGIILNDAREVLAEAIKIKPDASFAYYLFGIVETRSSRYGKAEENFRKALEVEPKLRWARLALGNLYVKQDKLKEALVEYDTYLADYTRVSNRSEVAQARARVALQLAKIK